MLEAGRKVNPVELLSHKWPYELPYRGLRGEKQATFYQGDISKSIAYADSDDVGVASATPTSLPFQNALIPNTRIDAAKMLSIFADSRPPGGHRESTREWSGIGRWIRFRASAGRRCASPGNHLRCRRCR